MLNLSFICSVCVVGLCSLVQTWGYVKFEFYKQCVLEDCR